MRLILKFVTAINVYAIGDLAQSLFTSDTAVFQSGKQLIAKSFDLPNVTIWVIIFAYYIINIL